MSNLRSKLIRLAYANPKMRESLLPLVRNAGYGDTTIITGPHVRIKYKTYPDSWVFIEELPVKGKKGLQTAEFAIGAQLSGTPHDAMMLENLLQYANLNKSMTFSQAVSAMKKAVKKGIENTNGQITNYAIKSLTSLPWLSEEWYLNVEPVDYKSIEVKGKDFSFTSEWRKFQVYSPGSTMQHEGDGQPHYSYIEQKTAASARKLFKMCKMKPDLLKTVSWDAFPAWLKGKKIAVKWGHSQWT